MPSSIVGLLLVALSCAICVCGDEGEGFHRLILRGGDVAATQQEAAPLCSAQLSAKQAESFTKNYWVDASGCPREDWLPIMAKTDPRKNKVFMNVGMNKGYNWAVWLDVFAPHTKVDSVKWGKLACANVTAESDKVAQCCGACDDCKVRFDTSQVPPVSPLPHITLIGVDLNRNNIVNAETIAEHVAKGTDGMNGQGVTFITMRAAASKSNGEVKVPDCAYGDEWCSMSGGTIEYMKKDRKYVMVPMLTLDEMATRLLDQHAVHFHHYGHHSSLHRPASVYHPLIDILMIDVEGFDCEVLDGAKQLFANKLIRVVIYENNAVQPCMRRSVKETTDMIEQNGYECYFQGQGRLWRVTGCWDERLNFHRWSNIMCMVRGDPYHAILQPLVVTEASVPETPPLPKGCREFRSNDPNCDLHNFT